MKNKMLFCRSRAFPASGMCRAHRRLEEDGLEAIDRITKGLAFRLRNRIPTRIMAEA